jgi:toxin-antitoxin system PIN domain toxin
MRLADAKYLLDLNVLIALTDEEHQHHSVVQRWFDVNDRLNWGTCALTQAGFVRIMANPKVRGYTVKEATHLLSLLTQHPRHIIWPIAGGWPAMTSPFEDRIFGHQQVTDAYLLGLAIQENGILVTLDRAISYLAAGPYGKNLLVLQP